MVGLPSLLCRNYHGMEGLIVSNLLILLTAIVIEICGDASIRIARTFRQVVVVRSPER